MFIFLLLLHFCYDHKHILSYVFKRNQIRSKLSRINHPSFLEEDAEGRAWISSERRIQNSISGRTPEKSSSHRAARPTTPTQPDDQQAQPPPPSSS